MQHNTSFSGQLYIIYSFRNSMHLSCLQTNKWWSYINNLKLSRYIIYCFTGWVRFDCTVQWNKFHRKFSSYSDHDVYLNQSWSFKCLRTRFKSIEELKNNKKQHQWEYSECFTLLISLFLKLAGYDNIALMVPEVRACDLFRMNSCSSLLTSLTKSAEMLLPWSSASAMATRCGIFVNGRKCT